MSVVRRWLRSFENGVTAVLKIRRWSRYLWGPLVVAVDAWLVLNRR